MYILGIFTGLNSCKKIIPYCLDIADNENKETCYKIFNAFSEMMGKSPAWYITH